MRAEDRSSGHLVVGFCGLSSAEDLGPLVDRFFLARGCFLLSRRRRRSFELFHVDLKTHSSSVLVELAGEFLPDWRVAFRDVFEVLL